MACVGDKELTDKEKLDVHGDLCPRQNNVFMIVGRLLTRTPFKIQEFCASDLDLKHGFEIINLEGDRLLFRLSNKSDKKSVLAKRPWFFKGSLLLLSDVPENTNPLLVDLSWSSFHVRLHDLPLCKQTKNMAVEVSNAIGIFEEYYEKETRGASLHVRVKINVDEPLPCFLKIKTLNKNEELVARFTYERLHTYCHLCGHLDHARKDCKLKGKFDQSLSIDEIPYGLWLHETLRPEISRDAEFMTTSGIQIRLMDEERIGVTVDDQADDPRQTKAFMIVGKLFGDSKAVKLQELGFSSSCPGDKLEEVINLEGGRYLFRMFDENFKQRVLDRRPWFYCGSLFVLEEVPGDMNPLQVDLSWCSFYVRIHDLPPCNQTKNVAVAIANKIGIFEDYDEKETRSVSLRVRVKINLNQPLMRYLKIKSTAGKEVVAQITYERLPIYCYLCGYLDHARRGCKLKNIINAKQPIVELPYGPWLRDGHRNGGSIEWRKNVGSGKMLIFVKTITGKTEGFTVEKWETVERLKLMIEDMVGISVAYQCLVYGGKVLKDERTFADYNIEKESTIHLAGRLIGFMRSFSRS